MTTLKHFLKPEWRKIITTMILIAVTYLYSSDYSALSADFVFYGLPFPYYQCVTGRLPNAILPVTNCDFHVGPDAFPYLWLIIDVLIWYIISCFIIWTYNKKRGKKK